MECTIYMTDGCNLRCSYCYQGDSKNSSVLKQETLEQILDFITAKNLPGDTIDIVFLGGEPLLNKRMLYKAIELIKSRYSELLELFRYHITTNGILLDEEIIDFFIENQFLVSISIDGDRETHNLNRLSVDGRDVYDRIILNMKKMKERDLDYSVRMTVTSNNAALLYHNIMYFHKLGVKKYHIGLDYVGEWSSEQYKVLDDQIGKLERFYLDTLADAEDTVMDIFDYKITTFVFERKPLYCSGGTEGHLVFNSKGEIYPCGFVTNDKEWELGTAAASLDKQKYLKTISGNIKKRAACHKCDIGFTCSGAKCGFLNYVETGFLNTASLKTCRLERLMYSHQKKVMEELYRRSHPRIMRFIHTAEEKDSLSSIMKQVMDGAVDSVNKEVG